MGLVYEYLMFAGKSSEDFNCHISGSGTYLSPTREMESISVPGRNGDLHIDYGKFNNVTIIYPAFITERFDENFGALKAFLLSKKGYHRLADSYHPDHFRRACFTGNISPKMTPRNLAGDFELSFDCDPRLFLKDGERKKTITESGIIFNPTQFVASPLIRLYGSGVLTIGEISIELDTTAEYVDIDCELEEALVAAENLNITTEGGKFPKLNPGENDITYTGSKLDIIPRFYTV